MFAVIFTFLISHLISHVLVYNPTLVLQDQINHWLIDNLLSVGWAVNGGFGSASDGDSKVVRASGELSTAWKACEFQLLLLCLFIYLSTWYLV